MTESFRWAHDPSSSIDDEGPTVIWTRGKGCASLAELIGGDGASKVGGDLATACIEARADLLVARHLSSFDLIDVAVPHHFVPGRVRSVAAAVAGGPHSSLAAGIAGRIATSLGLPGRIVIASPEAVDDKRAEVILNDIPPDDFGMARDVVRAVSARALVEGFEPGTLLVLGAPGGSWMQRQFFGPGRKLLYSASGGAVIVRSAPRRCFQAAGPVVALGAQMRVGDAAVLLDGRSIVPVAEAGRLVGIVRVDALTDFADDATIGDVMDAPVFLHVDDPLSDSTDVSRSLSGGAVPVVDRGGHLFGEIMQPGKSGPDS